MAEPKLDIRGVKNSRPNDLNRGLNFSEVKNPVGVKKTKIAESPLKKNVDSNGLNPNQSKLYFDAIKRGSAWLTPAKAKWDSFIIALNTGKHLPEKITRALKKHFGWTNEPKNNFSLNKIAKIIDRLPKELNNELPVKFDPIRRESPNSTKENKRWVRAAPWGREDGTAHGIILYPDFFMNDTSSGNPDDARAKTVIHEVLHSFGNTGESDWHDVIQADEKMIVGSVEIYINNPASYAGLIRDLAH